MNISKTSNVSMENNTLSLVMYPNHQVLFVNEYQLRYSLMSQMSWDQRYFFYPDFHIKRKMSTDKAISKPGTGFIKGLGPDLNIRLRLLSLGQVWRSSVA